MRGKILRDTNSGDGILIINNEQKTFTLQKHWQSNTPPKVGGVVDVELGEAREVLSVQAVDEASIAKEQAQKAIELASSQGKIWLSIAVEKVGLPTLVSIVILAISWLYLSTISIQISAGYKESVTFYQILKAINTSVGLNGLDGLKYASSGIYGFILIAALLAPTLTHFNSNKYLGLGYCAPLAFMIFIGFSLYMTILDGVNQAKGMANSFGGSQGAAMADKMMSEMLSMTMKAISLGLGLYVALIVAAYLAFIGARKYLSATAKF
jgi:hypothetical protein